MSQRTTMQIIATSNGHHDKPATPEKAGNRYDKQGRPLMSARRSATSSSRTITRADSSMPATVSPASTSRDNRKPPGSGDPDGVALTEASAYAKAIASDLARPVPTVSQTRTSSTGTITHVKDATRAARPLPRPPNESVDSEHQSGAGLPVQEVLQGDSQRSSDRVLHPKFSSAGTPVAPQGGSAVNFDFPRSPTIPALVDPRHEAPRAAASGKTRTSEAEALQSSSHPQSSRAHVTISMDRAKAVNGAELHRPRGRIPIDHLLSHPAIQSSLLSAISINAFLSLTGSSEVIRHQFTGESVGRWVLREWGVQIPEQSGIRWPNLTVWEGFRKSTEVFRG